MIQPSKNQPTLEDKVISLPKVIGKGYKKFWEFEGRYRILKGGRASKKSTTTAMNLVYRMMNDYHVKGHITHSLIVRSNFNLHFNSTYQELQRATERLGVKHLWKWTRAPLQGTYLPSGGTIIFRGMNDAEGLTSITVKDGYLCYVWLEEAYQLTSQEDFEKLDFSIRGELPSGLFHQFTLTLNPWSDQTWIKTEFYDKVNPKTGYNPALYDPVSKKLLRKEGEILAITRNYDCNEWLSEGDLALYEAMRIENPRKFEIVGRGNWGVAEGLVFQNIKVLDFDKKALAQKVDNRGKAIYKKMFGIDWGVVDPTAVAFVMGSKQEKAIYIYDEIYKSDLSNEQIVRALDNKGLLGQDIIADSADKRTIKEIKKYVPRLRGVKKSKDFKLAIIRGLQDYTIYVHPDCVNAITEFMTYAWMKDPVTEKTIEELPDGNDHYIDAFIYAVSEFGVKRWRFT